MSHGWLYVDLNAYFASVEQQDRPWLRGRPVAVAPVMADTSCCIAASYEARPYGIRTGTGIGEAKRLCPHLEVVEARPELYISYHHRMVEAVDMVLPIEDVCSIDEMACKLGAGQGDPDTALGIGRDLKAAVRDRLGKYVRCSVGLGPNRLLAKVIGATNKPDGLTLLRRDDLPGGVYHVPLGDWTGIGDRMLDRLARAGVTTTEDMYRCHEDQLGRIWGSVVGRRWWYLLRGHDLPEPATRRRTLGHGHVLPPEWRTADGARVVLLRLLAKAAARLRREGYWACGMTTSVSHLGRGHWEVRSRVRPTKDTPTLVELLHDQWETYRPSGRPLKVQVTLTHLMPNCSVGPSLFAEDRQRLVISRTMDAVNKRFGPNTLYLGAMHDARRTAPLRIAFTHIPVPGVDE